VSPLRLWVDGRATGAGRPVSADTEPGGIMSEFDKLKDDAEQYAKDHPEQVQKSLNPAFSSQFGMFMANGAPGFGSGGIGNLVEQINSATPANAKYISARK